MDCATSNLHFLRLFSKRSRFLVLSRTFQQETPETLNTHDSDSALYCTLWTPELILTLCPPVNTNPLTYLCYPVDFRVNPDSFSVTLWTPKLILTLSCAFVTLWSPELILILSCAFGTLWIPRFSLCHTVDFRVIPDSLFVITVRLHTFAFPVVMKWPVLVRHMIWVQIRVMTILFYINCQFLRQTVTSSFLVLSYKFVVCARVNEGQSSLEIFPPLAAAIFHRLCEL